MDTQPITLEQWPTLRLAPHEVKGAMQYLAHKTQKRVSFRWYTEGEGYTPQSVSVRVFVNDGIVATYAPGQVKINGQVLSLSPQQLGMASALVQDDWKKIADDEGQFVGYVDYNRIVIHIDITATDNEAARAILAYVVEQAIPLLDFDLGHILKEKEDEFGRSFTSTFQQSVKMRLQTRQEEFETRQREAEQAYYTVLEFEKERPTLDEEIKHLASLAEKRYSQLARAQAKALMQVQQSGLYSHVTLNNDGVLKATTTPITIEYQGYEFPVGRYEVEIPANGDVRIKALDDHPSADHPHPHVAGDGRPCLGNISADLAKLIGKMRYAEALQLLHTFLESYNSEAPYEKIGRFDPSGQFSDDDDDPCETCDEKVTPYCIFSCEHNNDMFSCADCCEHRTNYCYEDCDHNEDFERFHPCKDCTSEGSEDCYLTCRHNKEWELQKPCDGCEESECNQECEYHQKKEAVAHAR